MSLPQFPTNEPPLTRDDVINQIISSIAMEELGLSHIINAEGEKLQYALGTLFGKEAPENPLTLEELLKLNDSVHKTLDSTMMNQFFLKEKLVKALSASIMQGPPGERGPQGPATIKVIEEVDKLEPEDKPYVRNEGTDEDLKLKFGIPRGATGLSGKSAYEVAVEKGFKGSEEEWLAGLEGKSAYEVAVEKGFKGSEEEWLAGLEGKSAYEIAVEKGFKGSEEEWLNSLRASAVTIIPFASQQAPYVGTNASGEPVNAALLGFGYLGFNTGIGGEDANVAVSIDPSDGSFNLGLSNNKNKQVAFSLPFDMKLNSIYLTTGNWEAFSPFIPPGTVVFPYVQIYTAPAGTNSFLPLEGAIVKPTEGLHPESAQASTMLKAEISGLDIELDAGTRIAICGMMEIHGDSAARNYYLYFTGGVGLSSQVK